MKLSKEFMAMFREEAKKARCEINCWNGKSIDDLVCDYLERKELKPEDFTGAVILTADEAKKISTFFDVVECCAYGFKLSDEERILWEIIEKRIEQAEKGNA